MPGSIPCFISCNFAVFRKCFESESRRGEQSTAEKNYLLNKPDFEGYMETLPGASHKRGSPLNTGV